ncbi:hypothetical protein DL96DRAFT_1228128 [Flagelloscypha sp. PMI_526]|nr:hypothetical protein DL96DRAFT_1228128 [Flagelloscypha sp. PMI_526]
MRFHLAGCLLLAAAAYADSSLDPPGLRPLVNRGNVLLSSGQFNEASRVFSDAIDLSPADYLLYYKRATAYFSMHRHPYALEDFNKVLHLTSNTFSNAHLMIARINARDGHFDAARDSLAAYSKTNKGSTETAALLVDIDEAEKATTNTWGTRDAQLWSACVENASQALKIASHSIEIRQTRAECALASGDVEGAVGDFTRLTQLMPGSVPLYTRVFRLAFFLLPPSPSALSTLKACLHSDPDSKPCLSLHRLAKNLEKGFVKLEVLQNAEDWRGIISLLTASGKDKQLMTRYEDAMRENTTPEFLVGDAVTKLKNAPLPDSFKISPRRETLLRALCKAYVQINQPRRAAEWCEQLMSMEGMENDIDGLVGRGEQHILKEEYEEAVRVFESAFEASGRGNRDVHSRLQKAQKLLKQSRQKDYYKVLGVSRDADTRTIKKAFRNAAKTAHPDKGGSEAKMASVNEAYEVLSNPELRARFDAGDDPNDPQSGGGHPFPGGPFGGGGNPFGHQFFQQQGGFPGGGSFQFHFNG